jgi:hypothetical protein
VFLLYTLTITSSVFILNLWPAVLEIAQQVSYKSDMQARLVELMLALHMTRTTSVEVRHACTDDDCIY